MPLIRRITSPYWASKGHDWLPDGDFQGNALNDLKTAANALSVYRYDGDEATLHRIVAAIVCREGHIKNFGFALLDRKAIEDTGVSIDDDGKGETQDELVNSLHANLLNVSARRLLAVAELIHGTKRSELIKSEVKSCVRNSRDSGYILALAIPEDIKKYL